MTAAKIQPTPFRDDINGLRAWAVIAVLLFHFKVPGFSAGFIGVDIFFVISGFLMTRIIARGLAKNNFSIWQFYMARFRRIVPAVAALIAVLLILGWYWLPTPDYKTLGAQSAYSLSFLSNIHYWRSAGYFDAAAHEKWLLHTWSLGVEMQFYLLFPIFALLVWKLKPSLKVFFYCLVVLGLASLALSILASSWKPVAAFYLLPTRGWELAAGGLVYFLSQNKSFTSQRTKLFYLTGLILWLVGFVVIDSSLAWPSGWALLPVVGTALIILAAQNNTLLMGNFIAQWLGNISYSVYLWHWPLVVALYFAGLQGDWLWITGFFALSLVLGHLSYKLIETPTRKGLVKLSFSKQFASFAVLALAIGISAVSVRLFTFEGRLPEAVEIAAAEAENKDPRASECAPNQEQVSPSCIYGSGALGAIMIGDSHAMATITALQKAGQLFDKSSLFLGKSGCRPVRNLKNIENSQCYDFNNKLLDFELPKLANTGVPIVNVTRITGQFMGPNEDPDSKPTGYFNKVPKNHADQIFMMEFRDSFIETTCKMAERNPVYITRPIPEVVQHVPNTLAKNMMFGRKTEDVKITLDEYYERHAFTWAMQDEAAEKCGVKILNPLPYLCDDTYCYGSKNGRPLYYDDDHLSEYGNKFLVPMFEEVFKAN